MATGCPANPPAPNGYGVWTGRVPPELTDWAIGIRNNINASPYGTTWTRQYNGKTVLARKDYHTWTYKGGQLITGICIPGVTLYSPKALGFSEGPNNGDPLADPDRGIGDALFDADSGQTIQGPNPATVAATGLAAVGVVVLFWAAIRHAGRR